MTNDITPEWLLATGWRDRTPIDVTRSKYFSRPAANVRLIEADPDVELEYTLDLWLHPYGPELTVEAYPKGDGGPCKLELAVAHRPLTREVVTKVVELFAA